MGRRLKLEMVFGLEAEHTDVTTETTKHFNTTLRSYMVVISSTVTKNSDTHTHTHTHTLCLMRSVQLNGNRTADCG